MSTTRITHAGKTRDIPTEDFEVLKDRPEALKMYLDSMDRPAPRTGGAAPQVAPEQAGRRFVQSTLPERVTDWAKGAMSATTKALEPILGGAAANVVSQASQAGMGPDQFKRTEAPKGTPMADAIDNLTGFRNLQPQGNLEGMVRAGVTAGLDPLNAIAPLTTGARGLRMAGLFAKELGLSGASGVGAYGSTEIAKGLGGGEGAQLAAGIVGGVVPGVALGTAIRGGRQAARDAMGNTIQGREARRVVAEAGTENPRLAAELSQLQADAGVVGQAAGRTMDVPPIAVAGASKVLTDAARRRLTANSALQERTASQMAVARNTLEAGQFNRFGNPVVAQDTSLARFDIQNRENAARVELAETGFNEAKMAAQSVYSSSLPAEQVGARLVTLVDRVERQASAAVRPLYKELEGQGLRVNPQATSQLAEDLTELRDKNFAVNMPGFLREVVNRMNKSINPEGVGPQLVDASGAPLARVTPNEGGMSFEDLDELKRGLARATRSQRNPDVLRVYENAKRSVQEAVDGLPPEAAEAYRKADQEYARLVAKPFGQAAIEDIEKAKFDSSIVPALARNAEAARQLISVSGDEGKALVAEAVMTHLRRQSLDDKGEIKVARFRELLSDRGVGEVLNQLPELRVQLMKGRDGILAAQEALDRAKDAQKSLIKNDILGRFEGDASKAANFLLENPAEARRLFDQRPEAKDTLRAMVADRLMQMDDPLSVMKKRSTAETLNKLYGPEYTKELYAFMRVRQVLGKEIQTGINSLHASPDVVTKYLGTDPGNVVGRFLNQITSMAYKVSATVSGVALAAQRRADAKGMDQLFSDPKALPVILQAVRQEAERAAKAKEALSDEGVLARIAKSPEALDALRRAARYGQIAAEAAMAPENVQQGLRGTRAALQQDAQRANTQELELPPEEPIQ